MMSCPFGQKLRYLTDQNGPKRGPHENEFWVFPNAEMNVTNIWSGKIRWKNWVICLVFVFPSWVMVLKLSKKVHFFQVCSGNSNKSMSIKAIYIYASERSRYGLSDNGIVYYAMTHSFRNIKVKSRRVLLYFCWFSIFFDILIAKISWIVAQTPITIYGCMIYHFLKRYNGNFQKRICKLF